jgi:hypothetical protein
VFVLSQIRVMVQSLGLWDSVAKYTIEKFTFWTVFASVGSANKMNKLSLVGMQLPENI